MTENTPKVADCPFCGKADTLKLTSAEELANEGEDDPLPWEHSPSWCVICDASTPGGLGGCGASGGFFPSEDEAIAAWNRRATSASPSPAPLTDEQVEPLFREVKAMLTVGEKDEWFWFAWGVEMGERAHGIRAEVGINGLTEAETSVTASVAGIVAAPSPAAELTDKLRDVRDAQGNSVGNDPYMAGLYNGLELALAIAEDRDPAYRNLSKEATAAFARAVLAASSPSPTEPVARYEAVLEEVAQGWDGCMYDAPGGEIDIGAAIRKQLTELLSLAAISQPSAGGSEHTKAAQDVLTERERQVNAEGWTPEHDDEHRNGELAFAAAAYAHQAAARGWVFRELPGDAHNYTSDEPPNDWPDAWDTSWWRPKNPRRDLVRAAALLLAEIERLDRAATPSADAQGKEGGKK